MITVLPSDRFPIRAPRVDWDQPDPARPRPRLALHRPRRLRRRAGARSGTRTWVFVGHVSEVPAAQRLRAQAIGPQPVIMTRDATGEIHLLLNRCAHRANLVCDDRPGQRQLVPLPVPRLDVPQHRRAARLPVQQRLRRQEQAGRAWAACRASPSYHGFVFGSFAPDGPTLREHLGAAAGEFDRLVAPVARGRGRADRGLAAAQDAGQLEDAAENETDGYHPQFVHGSIFGVDRQRDRRRSTASVDRGDARPRQRPHRERPAPGVPPDRPAAAAGSARPRSGSPTTSPAMRDAARRRRRGDPRSTARRT